MTGFSCLGIFTKSSQFARSLQTLFSVFRATSALITAVLMSTFLAALAAQDLVGEEAVDADGNHYFGTMARSLSTLFRLFVGEGWHDVMYASSDVTNYATNFLFIAFTIVIALLCSQLLVGVIINLYTEVQKLNSDRLYTVLFNVLYHELNPQERDLIKQTLLVLNRQMRHLHSAIDVVHKAAPCDKGLRMAALYAEIESDQGSQQLKEESRALKVAELNQPAIADDTPFRSWAEHMLDNLDEQQVQRILARNLWIVRHAASIKEVAMNATSVTGQQEPARQHFAIMQAFQKVDGGCDFNSFRKYLATTRREQRPWGLHRLNVLVPSGGHEVFMEISKNRAKVDYMAWIKWWNYSPKRAGWDGCARSLEPNITR